jgi:peroxiredoxin
VIGISPDGKIAKVFPKGQPKRHDDLVLKALGELSAARQPQAK